MALYTVIPVVHDALERMGEIIKGPSTDPLIENGPRSRIKPK